MRHLRLYTYVLLAIIGAISAGTFSVSLNAQPLPSRPVVFEKPRLQTRFLAGVVLSGTADDYTAGIPMVYAPICNHLQAGSGWGYSAGLTFDYLLNREWSLSLQTRYGRYPGSFQRLEPIGTSYVGDGDNPNYVVITIDSDIQLDVLGADLLVKWSPSTVGSSQTRFGLAAGPSFDVPVVGKMSQRHTMTVYDADGEFVTNREIATTDGEKIRERELATDVDMDRLKGYRAGIRTGAYLSFSLGSGAYLTPGLYADLPMTTMTDFRWGSLSTYECQVELSIGL